jgi:TolB-like protein/DNA-binding winged helix-turn-helix (wHTH) protein/Flp pilus assembly protein TadD
MDPATSSIRFGSFVLDPRAGELLKDGLRIKIQEKPLRLLEALLARPAEVVTRDELRALLWPADTFVDFEGGLNTAINKVRAALGDSADSPRFVETVGRRGYRFIAPLEPASTTAPTPPASVEEWSEPASPARSRRGWFLPAVGLAVLAAVVAGVWIRRSRSTPAPIKSVAVLPFANFSGNPDEEYFVDGMTEALISDLASIRSLRVIARQSVMRYKGSQTAVRQIAKDLNVDAMVEGSAVRSGTRVRLTAQLIDARDESHLWTRTFDRDMGDLLALQAEIARTIADGVRAVLTPQERARLAQSRSANQEAYDLYLRGRYFFNRRGGADTEGNLRKAVSYFEQAIERDPGFALAYASEAETWGPLGFLAFVSPAEALEPMKRNASRALELDGGLAEGHTAMGACLAFHEWDWAAAEREFKRAIELNPRYSVARAWYGLHLDNMGRTDESLSEARLALAEDPFNIAHNARLAAALLSAGHQEEALAQQRRTVELDAQSQYAHNGLAILLAGTGRYDEALEEYRNSGSRSGAALAAALGGRPDEARALLTELKAAPNGRYRSPLVPAGLHAALGENDAAFSFLEEAFATRVPALSQVKIDGRWKPLRSDPRYADLLRRMKLP